MGCSSFEAANWFFYQELYKNYHPVFSNEYQIFWEENTAGQNFVLPGDTVQISLDWVDAASCKIIVKGADSLNGIADVHLNCDAVPQEDSLYASLMFNSFINIAGTPQSPSNQCNLPLQSDTTIPIAITNGYGEATVTSMPDNATMLSLENVFCKNVYTVTGSFLNSVTVSEFDAQTGMLVVGNNGENQILTDGVKAVYCGSEKVPVERVVIDERRIYLFTKKTADELTSLLGMSNCVQVIK